MPTVRKLIFTNKEVYHIFNRSVANEMILNNNRDINRFLNLINFYRKSQLIRYSYFSRLKEAEKRQYVELTQNNPPVIEIYAYSLMPNHFHLLIKQKSSKGIQKFVSNIQNGFAKYYNLKNKRHGPLFLRPFKATHVSKDEELLHVSRYIHLNPVTSFLMNFKELRNSKFTSLPFYINNDKQGIVNVSLILKLTGSISRYHEFVKNQVDYQRKLNEIKHLVIE